ncbi:hypothetical protein MBLNU13_g00605t1 [Cladosporium sp. NU13]
MANHRSVVTPLPAARAATPGVIGSSQNNNANVARGVVGSLQNQLNMARGISGSQNHTMAPAASTNGAPHSYAPDLWDRYAQLKEADGAKNALIEDMLSRYDSVIRQCQNLINAQNARETQISRANEFSALVQQQDKYITHLQNLMNGNPFIVLVVDGNNFLFNDAFIRDGEEGGRRAAVVFKDEVTEWVSKSVKPSPSDFKVLIKVYADFEGLAGTFTRGGIIKNLSTFKEFARGFNFDTLFELIDIGGGDVNNRILDHFKLFLHDYHCHQVVFGGVSQLLDNNVELEDKITRRVALLQRVLTDVNVPFKKVSFAKVFRTSNIIPSIATVTPRTGTPASTVETASGNLPVSRSRNDSGASSATSAVETASGNLPTPHSRNDSHASSIASATVPALAAPAAKSWAKLAQDVATLPQTSTVQRPVDPPSRLHNKKGQRIDPPFLLDWEALKRVKQIKMCNMHYLHPQGCKFPEEQCNHRHSYKATDAELVILRSVSRETACRNGIGCDDPDCLYGHRCPYPPVTEGSMRGLACQLGEKCRFPREMHGIKDATPARATNTGKR